VIVTVPTKLLLGVNVTLQVPEESVQDAAGLKVPNDAGDWVNVTVPTGVEGVPGELSETVTTQLVGVFGTADEGVQTTAVEVVL
jgi:hypothetical protein